MRIKFQDEELPHELFLTTRQTTKTRNVSSKLISANINFRKAKLFKTIQLGGFLPNMLERLGKNNNRPCYSFSCG